MEIYMKCHYRTIFLSDVHLGTAGCHADALKDFLKRFGAEHIVFVGDIIDFWALRRRIYFPQSHIDVVRLILKLSSKGEKLEGGERGVPTRITYVPGNHDEVIRKFLLPMTLGNITIVNDFVLELADGRKMLVIHGDIFDQVMKYAKWLALAGDIGYTVLLRANTWVNFCRRRVGYPYWSLSAFVKGAVKSAVNFIGKYEETLEAEARSRGVDGVICGHIHHAGLRKTEHGFVYANCGDWVESMTSIVEHHDGTLELLRWMDIVPAADGTVPLALEEAA